jgi:hypothetical protein
MSEKKIVPKHHWTYLEMGEGSPDNPRQAGTRVIPI